MNMGLNVDIGAIPDSEHLRDVIIDAFAELFAAA
jgi:hypothetical protein